MIGQSVGSDANPLSCFLFRPRKRLEKRRKRSHTNVSNASVIRTSRVSQTLLHPPSLLPSMGTTRQKSSCRNRLQNGPHSLLRMKVGTLPTGSHTAAYTAKHGPSGQGRYHYPRSVPHVHQHPRAGYQNGKFCRFWGLVGGAPKERREPRDSDALMCVAVPRRRGPAGLRDLFATW